MAVLKRRIHTVRKFKHSSEACHSCKQRLRLLTGSKYCIPLELYKKIDPIQGITYEITCYEPWKVLLEEHDQR